MIKTAFQMSRRTCFLKKLLFGKSDYFSNSDLGQNLFQCFVEIFRQVSENCILRVHWNFLKKKGFPFWQFFFLLGGLWAMHFRIFRQKNFNSFPSLLSTYPERFDENYLFQKTRIVLPFCDFEWQIFWILGEKLRDGCRNGAWMSRLHFLAKLLLKIVQIFFCVFCVLVDLSSFLVKFVRQGFQNCNLRTIG